FTPLFVSFDEKFDDASVAQSLCGIALNNSKKLHRRSAYKQKAVRFFCTLHWKMSILYPTNPHKKYTNQRGSFIHSVN
ncbi:hypothetical protein, partial [Ruminococcus callidus]|uniref:hypothetical protein n=1 Tax=Ruminococcus callidus TaxID=40519 RepID=UPI0023F6DB0C